MKGIAVDPVARTCRAEAGLTWGELDAATQEHGLAVTGGRVSTTGLGGLVLGGGSGWIERKCGYAVDNLLSVEIVTADGQILTASESENPDLFWGTRGGGGNFGVATSFELRLHPIGPTILGGMLMYPASMAAAVLRNFRDVMADGSRRGRFGRCSAHRPARRVRPRAGARATGGRSDRLLRGAGRGGCGGAAAAARARHAGARYGRPNAVRGLTAAHRSRLPCGDAQLLDRRLSHRASRRGDRDHVPLASVEALSPDPDPHASRWRDERAGAGRQDGDRAAPGAIQHPHHVTVAGPRR